MVTRTFTRHATIIAVLLAALLGGCNLAALVAGPLDKAEREGSHKVDAEYRKLANSSFVVLVSAPAVLQGSFPDTPVRIQMQVSETLAKTVGAAGYVPPARAAEYQYNHPNWSARPMGDIAKDLGVNRIVYIELAEYRLNDPGNQYVWDGIASGLVAVVEADSTTPDDFRFQKRISVKFPDMSGYSQGEMPYPAVHGELSRRFAERAAWLFVDHEEPNAIKY